jgi:hypothetical protein
MSDKKSFKKGRKNRRSKKQFYKMKGCSKTKKHLGGSNLAYPSNNVPRMSNSNLAYTGTGSLKNAYPNPGPKPEFRGWLNTQIQNGGRACSCGCGPKCNCPPSCSCGCNSKSSHQKGGNNGLPYGQHLPGMQGIPYPGGTVGPPLVTGNISTWPGVDNVSGSGNYYKLNTYDNGFVTNIKNIGAQPPFTGNNFVGGKKRHSKINKRYRKRLHGGSGMNLSNTIGQDFVNLGRQFSSGLGNAYNAFNGYYQTASPLPWKGQLATTPSANALKLLKM